jgi:hypothetical protein
MGRTIDYLGNEKNRFLQDYGKPIAEERRDDAANPFEKEMFQAWVDYYDNLIATTDTILGKAPTQIQWDKKQFKGALKSERSALAEVIQAIRDEIEEKVGDRPKYSKSTRRQLRTLIQLLRVEKITDREMIKLANEDY